MEEKIVQVAISRVIIRSRGTVNVYASADQISAENARLLSEKNLLAVQTLNIDGPSSREEPRRAYPVTRVTADTATPSITQGCHWLDNNESKGAPSCYVHVNVSANGQSAAKVSFENINPDVVK